MKVVFEKITAIVFTLVLGTTIWGKDNPSNFSDWGKPLSTDFTVVYSWENRQLISDAPALIQLSDGRFLCSVQLWSRDETAEKLYGKDRCLIFKSDDKGTSWQEIARLPFATGKFLQHQDRIYFIGAGTNWQGLWVCYSKDRGKNWSSPIQVIEGKVYAASTGWIVHQNTLYWAMDDMKPSVTDRGVFAVAADLSRELDSPNAWRKSNIIKHPGIPEVFGRGSHNKGKWLEPNVIYFNGRLHLVVRVRVSRNKIDGLVPNIGAICDLSDNNHQLDLAFSHYYNIPGAQNHFHIVYDSVTALYWMTCNQVTGIAKNLYRGWGKERRFLMLYFSIDGQNWLPADCLAMWPKERQAFNYCTPVIDGNDLLFVSRTAKHAKNQHDNDMITFHRVKNFRQSAVNPFPE
jgi:hypothetical protein